jgi:hypothetical protein
LIKLALAILLTLETAGCLALWGLLNARFRRPDVPWYRALRRWQSERDFVPAGARWLRLYGRFYVALISTVLVGLLLAAVEGHLIRVRP